MTPGTLSRILTLAHAFGLGAVAVMSLIWAGLI